MQKHFKFAPQHRLGKVCLFTIGLLLTMLADMAMAQSTVKVVIQHD